MNAAVYHRKLARVLDRMGGLYLLPDILERIADRRMQSFASDNSWAVTEINEYPRAMTLDIIAAVGDLPDCRRLHGRVLDFARQMGVPLVRAYGRRGWIPDAAEHGWRALTTNVVYCKDM